MALGAPGSFGAQLKTLREAAGDTQEEVSPTVVLRLMHDLHVHAATGGARTSRRGAMGGCLRGGPPFTRFADERHASVQKRVVTANRSARGEPGVMFVLLCA